MKKILISSAYIYPICPLSTNHARMFIIGDIIARYSRKNGKQVFFPIASHYSGNTAHRIAKVFAKFFMKDEMITEEDREIFNLYKNIYHIPTGILKNFVDPLVILDFYNQEILWELKSLDISGDYQYSYTTGHEDFPIFINTIISLYKKNNLLVLNKNNELALNYDDANWKEKVLDLLDQIEFIQSFHKNNILSAMRDIRSDWGLLREDGFGVIYDKKWIIDPMFDSELFTIFDLYIRFKKEYGDESIDTESIFINLFEVLMNQGESKSALVDNISSWLPCDVFVCEEHLKNWIVKKLYAESSLLNEKYRTRKYFVLGMGLLDGKRMSASKGTAILVNNLINRYGSTKTRLIILLGGGHPSKTYDYDRSLPEQANKLLSNFTNYYTYLVSFIHQKILEDESENRVLEFEVIRNTIEENIDKGYYRQIIVELLSILPARFPSPNIKTGRFLLSLYQEYLDILLPSLIKEFDCHKKY